MMPAPQLKTKPGIGRESFGRLGFVRDRFAVGPGDGGFLAQVAKDLAHAGAALGFHNAIDDQIVHFIERRDAFGLPICRRCRGLMDFSASF